MYDLVMETSEQGILPHRLQEAMDLRGMTAADLAKASGVHKATISLILSGARPNTPAIIAAKLARGLLVSVDYLVGIAEKPEPYALAVNELIIDLTRAAQKLTNRRLRDLLMTTRGYMESSEEMRGNPDLLEENLLDMIEEAGGRASRDQLLDILQADADNDDDDNLLDGDGGIPPDQSE